MTTPPPPPGFIPLPPYGPFAETVGPFLYEPQTVGSRVGFWVEEKHRNRNHMVHGGMVSTLIDTAMAVALRTALGQTPGNTQRLVTTQLSISFISNAGPGEWVEARFDVLKAGKRIAFLEGKVFAGERCIAQANGQFAILPPTAAPAS